MPTACRLFRPFPLSEPLLYDLFFKKEEEYDYDLIEQSDGRKTVLKIYVEPKGSDNFGYKCNCSIDIPHYFYNKEQGRVAVKSTSNVFIRTYSTGLGNIFAIFAAKWLSPRVISAMTIVAKTIDKKIDDLFLPILFNIGEKERELENEFLDVRRFWMKKIPDMYVRGAGISGIKLQDSPEYQRYVRTLGGKLMSIVFRWGGITILLSGEGLIFTYTDFSSLNEASTFFKNIIDKLIKKDVMIFL